MRLVSVKQDKGFSAKIEIDRIKNGVTKRETVTVKTGTEMLAISGGRDLYEPYVVSGFEAASGNEYVEFANYERLYMDKPMGDIDENVLKKAQIQRTIETHLDKELRWNPKGIKVLSLFFIDEVSKYRTDDDSIGLYAKMFEECYEEIISRQCYEELKAKYPLEGCHEGYFSKDKKGHLKNTKGDTVDDTTTYDLIMKNKEQLLSFSSPLRFIFSHSALKEGWDNPNVFQVCTLVEQKSTWTIRQKVGRGLRLCVNQDGERVDDKDINVLDVMASESFAEFADKLQKEIEKETGMRFGIVDIRLFEDLTVADKIEIKIEVVNDEIEIIAPENVVIPQEKIEEIKAQPIEIIQTKPVVEVEIERPATYEERKEIVEHFEKKDYVDKKGKIKDTMKSALEHNTLDLPEKYEKARECIMGIIKNADKKVKIKDDADKVTVRLNKQVLISPEFLELWDRIKQKTTYRVKIDEQQLIDESVKQLKELPRFAKARVVTKTARIDVEKSGVGFTEISNRTIDIENTHAEMPDFIRNVDDECFIAGRTILEILKQSGRVRDLRENPQAFTEKFIEIVKDVLHDLEIDGIKYEKLEGKEYYVQEIFDATEITAWINHNAVGVTKAPQTHVIYDSDTVELPFAVALNSDPDVKMFFKIPRKFVIDTPIGTYNPDWAVYMTKDGTEKLYFVIESKGTTKKRDLRTPEEQKIHCGAAHFEALDNGVYFPDEPVKVWGDFKNNV